ncbi:tagaturonate reductase [Hymenobacter sp. UV11]|uniref:tagaturonate reductase n=1 Tax=Hymenobacter sp. UV11 TaxID=1849735 RepID=UPI00105F69EE|nr:tagaturonate reductase [Hymenobacter sp. UV11]TDN38163.1 altronate oxidoreductase [Hymenobacter sp. UV11]TFZ67664.1 tagaturonate reductase [Hymenobacter sp. UV11]
MPILSEELVRNGAAAPGVSLPPPALLSLPEKVLQFGTGVLLRGLPDFLIDQANRQGIFNGRVVVVKSTDGGDATAFARQDNLYTVCVRGVEDGQSVSQNVVCAGISRVLSAKSQWAEVLQVATSPELQIVLSNTTEVGIVLDETDDVRATPPRSFPGKLLAVLLARYQAFAGAADKGLVIVPTELIPENGTKLRNILRELAENQVPDAGFLHWLETANTICNSLVDRIVPGAPAAAAAADLAQELGYDDELLTMSEVYRLWAIEGDERVKAILSFEQADAGIIVQPDINQFRELKLRLLNGTHSLACGLAVLADVPTVREAMEDDHLLTYIRNLMLADLLPGIPYPLDEKVGQRFGMQVLDRFRNPAVEHRWLAITLNYSAKLQMRVVPDLQHYYHRFGAVPQYVALGFAAYLLFMRGVRQEGNKWYGEAQGQEYLIQDEQAGYFADLWAHQSATSLVQIVLSNHTLWNTDLTALPGFTAAVTRYLGQLQLKGAAATLAAMLNKNQRAAV